MLATFSCGSGVGGVSTDDVSVASYHVSCRLVSSGDSQLLGDLQVLDVGQIVAGDLHLPSSVESRLPVPHAGEAVCARLVRLHNLRVSFGLDAASPTATGVDVPLVLALQAASGALIDVVEYDAKDAA